jgi:hypothetical protein
MAALVLLAAAVPATIALSIWSDVGSVQEEITKRKMDAGNMSIPGDYHTLYDETRRD